MTLADHAGLELLTMRKLGEVLGVEAMSLYNHVANKEDLVDGMIDIVFSEIDLPGTGTWMPAMRRRSTSLRGVLMRHRWAVGLMETRRNPGPANLRHHDAVLGSFRAAGFSITAAAHAYSLLDSYIYGFAQTQLNLPLETPAQIAEVGKNMLQQFPVNDYPNLAEMIEHAMKPGYDHDGEFDFGLDVVLEGIDRAI
ncbi:MAG: TetR/AcrR family transcriptional regulator C-terminal domain-containing protein, partial [Rhodoglobus sp.]